MQLTPPLLIGGDASLPFARDAATCVQQLMLRRPDEAAALIAAYAGAGADIILAPTGGLTMLSLSQYEDTPDARLLNTAIVELTRQVAGAQARIAGHIANSGHLYEPFGPLPFTDLVDTYAEQALELADAGVDLLYLSGMRTLGGARAAILGARQAHLPLLICMHIQPDEEGARRPDMLACLLTAQAVGADAFGVSCADIAEMERVVARLAPYAKVPLIACLDTRDTEPETLLRHGFEALARGARILAPGEGATAAHTAALRQLLDTFDFAAFPLPEQAQDTPLLLSDEARAYFLEEDFTVTEPVDCALDMSEAILDAEDGGADALTIRLRSIDDAWHLGQNAHMAATAVNLLADGEEPLEMALLYYQGRALVDKRSDVPRDVMESLAAWYGAIIR